MTRDVRKRIGIIGFGFIGSNIYQRICENPCYGLDIAFVFNRTRSKLEHLPPDLILDDLAHLDNFECDLIVETAHPDISREHGATILNSANYMPLSATALSDPEVERKLLEAASAHGTHLIVPHGALVGCDSLYEWRHQWDSVTITFKKNPANIDFSVSGIDPAAITSAQTVYEGPVRQIAKLYPRNVNTMVTCALATTGLDQCRGVLIADPALNVAIAQVLAVGRDGSRLETKKVQPVLGVSGTEMFDSVFHSICIATGHHDEISFV